MQFYMTKGKLLFKKSNKLFKSSYMENAKRISKLMKENPEQGKDVFIKWVEYAANNKELYKVIDLGFS